MSSFTTEDTGAKSQRDEVASNTDLTSPQSSISLQSKAQAMLSDEKFLVLPDDITETKAYRPSDSEKQVSSPEVSHQHSEKQVGSPEASHQHSEKQVAPSDMSQNESEKQLATRYEPEKRVSMQLDSEKIAAITTPNTAQVETPQSAVLSPIFPRSSSYREFGFYSTSNLINIIICDPDRLAVYYANMTVFTRGKADVTLHDMSNNWNVRLSGPAMKPKDGQTGTVVAVAEYAGEGNNVKLGFGNPSQVEDVRWTLMKHVPGSKKDKGKGEKYELSFSSSGQEPKRDFQWVIGGESTSKDSYRLMSGTSVVASFKYASLASFKKRGMLRLYDIIEMDELRPMICLSCAALCEKQRRKTVKKSFLLS